MGTVVATILAHSPPSEFGDAMRAVDRQTRSPDHVLILDNGSTPAIPLATIERFFSTNRTPWTLLRTSENLGVGGGHNFLFAQANRFSPMWIWALEHDTVVEAECLRGLLEIGSSAEERVGAVVPSLARSPDEVLPQARAAALGEWRTGGRLTFNAVLLRAAMLGDIGPVREDLFIGGEDFDYSRRMEQQGWKIVSSRRNLGLHRSKGNKRHGIAPTPRRQYYSTRGALLVQADPVRKAGLAVRLAAGAARDLGREHPARRLAARAVGIADGLTQSGGPRSYWFL